MLIFRRNQIVITSLIVVIVCAGYLNYKYNQAKITNSTAKDPIGSAYFVENTEDLTDEDNISVAQINGDYFIVTNAEKERSRDEQKEVLQNVINNQNADADAKKKAQEELIAISQIIEKEMKIESVLKGKGLKNIVAFVGKEKVDIVIKADEKVISSSTAIILDEVMRETGIEATNIKISPYKE